VNHDQSGGPLESDGNLPTESSTTSEQVTFQNAIPVLPVSDIGRMMVFYGGLGFAEIWRDADYDIVKRDGVELHLWRCRDESIQGTGDCRVYVTNIKALYREYETSHIAHANVILVTLPWGLKEFTIVDPDGNRITFAELAEQRSPQARSSYPARGASRLGVSR